MNAEELLMNNLKYDFPLVSTYDNRYAETDAGTLEASCGLDPVICYELATRYKDGTGGVPCSPEKALHYYQKVLCSQKNIRAMYWAGYLCLLFLPGMEQDGLIYLKTADSLGDKDAPWLLGHVYFKMANIAPNDNEKAYALFLRAKERGTGIDVDRSLGQVAEELGWIDKARKHYTDGLNKGDKVCANYLGYMYLAGDGVEQNLDYAKRFFRTALEATEITLEGYAQKMLALIDMETGSPKEKYDAFVYMEKHPQVDLFKLPMGKACMSGIPGYLEKDEGRAMQYFKAAPDSDRGEAFWHIAWILLDPEDKEQHERYMLSSAHLGYGPAIYVVQNDYNLILRHLRESTGLLVKTYDSKYDKASIDTVFKAAESDPAAMYELASRFRLGEDIVQNQDEAAKWYSKTLWEQRNVRAMHWLAVYLDEEKGDSALAMEFWKEAYSYGDADSAVNLGILYEFGPESGIADLKTDLNKALQMFRFAQSHGRNDMDVQFGRVYQKMGDYDLAEKHLRRAVSLDGSNAFAVSTLGEFYLDKNNPKYNEAEAVRLLTQAANMGDDDAREMLKELEQLRNQKKAKQKQKTTATEKIPSVEELLSEEAQIEAKGINNGAVLMECLSILSFALKHYPDHPEVLRRWILNANLRAYMIKFTGKTDKERQTAYSAFVDVLGRIIHLEEVCGKLDARMVQESSFACTHLAELALGVDQDEYAWNLLEHADRSLVPFAGVVAVMALFKKDDALETNSSLSPREKKRLRDGYYQQLKKEVDILSKTVEKAEGWNSQGVERATGFMALVMCYRTKAYEPYIRYNPRLAQKYKEKCAALNPEMAKGL